jgi:hypothetical protein
LSSHDIKNPTGGVDMRYVMEASNPDDHLLEPTVGEHPLPDYGPVISLNRLLRTRTRGGVGAGGLRSPATRSGFLS